MLVKDLGILFIGASACCHLIRSTG